MAKPDSPEEVKNYFRKISVILVVVAAIILFVGERIKVRNRRYHSLITEGIVTEVGSNATVYHYVAYKFVVNNKTYLGTTNVSFCKKCNYKCCAIGAKVRVRYYINDPDNNDLVQ